MKSEDEQNENALIPSEGRGLATRSSALVRRALENPLAQKAISNSIGMEFVRIASGSFEMGSNNGEADEMPVHRVTIGQGFLMGKYEVTQAQWQAVMGNNPSYFKGDDNLPVENVSWNDTQEYIKTLNEMNEMNDGFEYRLPTEAQWEYACRAGTTGDYYAQNPDDVGWYSDNSGKRTHRVGSKQPNAYGLYDMSGNVWEWCEDWHHYTYLDAPPDGSAWVSGGEPVYGLRGRVMRGGSWLDHKKTLRSACRFGLMQNFRYDLVTVGFRLVAIVRTL